MIPKVRNIRECIEIIRAEDPDSKIGEGFLRRAIKSGQLPVAFYAGNKAMINVQTLIDFLCGK